MIELCKEGLILIFLKKWGKKRNIWKNWSFLYGLTVFMTLYSQYLGHPLADKILLWHMKRTYIGTVHFYFSQKLWKSKIFEKNYYFFIWTYNVHEFVPTTSQLHLNGFKTAGAHGKKMYGAVQKGGGKFDVLKLKNRKHFENLWHD